MVLCSPRLHAEGGFHPARNHSIFTQGKRERLASQEGVIKLLTGKKAAGIMHLNSIPGAGISALSFLLHLVIDSGFHFFVRLRQKRSVLRRQPGISGQIPPGFFSLASFYQGCYTVSVWLKSLCFCSDSEDFNSCLTVFPDFTQKLLPLDNFGKKLCIYCQEKHPRR